MRVPDASDLSPRFTTPGSSRHCFTVGHDDRTLVPTLGPKDRGDVGGYGEWTKGSEGNRGLGGVGGVGVVWTVEVGERTRWGTVLDPDSEGDLESIPWSGPPV